MKNRPSDERLISTLKIVDFILLRVINMCFRYYQWRIERFVAKSTRSQRRKVWQNLVKSHFLIKAKMILGYQDAKHCLELADLHQAATDIVNPDEEIWESLDLRKL